MIGKHRSGERGGTEFRLKSYAERGGIGARVRDGGSIICPGGMGGVAWGDGRSGAGV